MVVRNARLAYDVTIWCATRRRDRFRSVQNSLSVETTAAPSGTLQHVMNPFNRLTKGNADFQVRGACGPAATRLQAANSAGRVILKGNRCRHHRHILASIAEGEANTTVFQIMERLIYLSDLRRFLLSQMGQPFALHRNSLPP